MPNQPQGKFLEAAEGCAPIEIPSTATAKVVGLNADQVDGFEGHAQQHSVTDLADHTFPGGGTTFLRDDGTFASPPGGGAHNILSATHTDTIAATFVRGDLLIVESTPKLTRLPIGTLGQRVGSSGLDPAWWSDAYAGSLAEDIQFNFTPTYDIPTKTTTITFAGTIRNDAVTYAKMQNVSAVSRLLGRGSAAGAGDPEEITLGTNLSMAGTVLNAASGGGTTPAWKGAICAAWGDGDPAPALRHMEAAGVVAPTPTNITVSVARCAFFKLDTALVVNKIRWYGVGATTGIYRVAVYRVSDAVRMFQALDFNTALAAWGSAAAGGVTLAADVLYLIAVAVDTTGTTAGILALGPAVAATTGQMVNPLGWPGNLDFDAATPKIAPFGFVQFAVTNGLLPTTLPALVNQAAWAGGMPAFFLDNNNA